MNSALSVALLHFLWQGAGIAFLLAVALVFAKTARVRYGLACTALLAMPVVFAVTFVMQWPEQPAGRRFPVSLTLPTPSAVTGDALPASKPQPFDPVPLWFAGVALLYGYRFVGWIAAQRLRRRGVCSAPEVWQQRVLELSSRLRMTCPVALLESALAQTPVTMGTLRPVILMPLGLLAGLPVEQVEAILLHELAHIRRHDYLVNLAQAVIEGLLFYHPAVWWVSRVIRREREMCCDDIAVAAVGDALTYTRALAALEEHRVRVPILAVTGGPLMSRIHRLLGRPSRFSTAPALVFLALATGAALLAYEPAPSPLPAPIPAPAPIPQPAPAPEPAPAPAPVPQAAPQTQPGPAIPQPALELTPVSRELETPYDQWVNQEVVWIISPDERSAFRRLQTDEERQQFIEQFWLRRDPTPDTEENELKEEHYRRIAWANDRFSSGIPGWKTDRGMVYVKFGPPDEREEHPTLGPGARPIDEGGGQTTFFPYEKWRYRNLEGVGQDVLIEFVDKTMTNEYRMTWNPSDKDALLRIPGGGLTLYEQMGLADKTNRFVPPRNPPPNAFDRLQRYMNIRPRPAQ